MDIPFDILHFEEIKYLSVSEILRFCKTSKEMNLICQDPETWAYLLWRDFDIQSDTPRETYKEAYYVHQVSDIYKENIYRASETLPINPEKVIDVLITMGYQDMGDVFEWRNLGQIQKGIGKFQLVDGEVYVYDFDPYLFESNSSIALQKGDYEKIIRVLEEILPNIFNKKYPFETNRPNEYTITVDLAVFQHIFNFYNSF